MTLTKEDIEVIHGRLGLWGDDFKEFLGSEEMGEIYTKVREDAQLEGVCPNPQDTFRAFSTIVPERLKVIWLLMDPYPRKYKGGAMQATGIAMDCSNAPDGQIQPSLKYFYEAIEKELGEKVERTGDLTYLHEQGCMMLNTDLTCKLNKTGSHAGLWAPFMKYFFEEILRGKELVFVLAGKESEKLEKYISPFGNTILKVSHPSSAQYSKSENGWDSKGVFNQINKILVSQGKEAICWNKRTYDSDLPF